MNFKINNVNGIQTNASGRTYIQDVDSNLTLTAQDPATDSAIKVLSNTKGSDDKYFLIESKDAVVKNFDISGFNKSEFSSSLGCFFFCQQYL